MLIEANLKRNSKGNNLEDVLRVLDCIVINNDFKIMSSSRDIIAGYLQEALPTSISHALNLDELTTLLDYYESDENYTLNAYEVLPNTFGLGIVKEITDLKDKISNNNLNKFSRYFILVKSPDTCTVITYNPEVTELSFSKIRLANGTRIKTSLVQLDSIIIERDIPSKKILDNNLVNVNVYENV